MSNKALIQKEKYYHCSPDRHTTGTILYGTAKPDRGEYWNKYPWMYITTSPVPHYSIIETATEENWYVYEVKPMGKVYEGNWDDLIVSAIEIVKKVGHARGLANKTGSFVHRQLKLNMRRNGTLVAIWKQNEEFKKAKGR